MRCKMKLIVAIAVASVGSIGVISANSTALPLDSPSAGFVTMTPLTGVASTSIDLRPPAGAACQGDSSTGGYRWQTFIASVFIDPGTLTYGGGAGPQSIGGGVVFPMLSAGGGTPIVDQTTSVGTALLTPFPTF